MQQSSEIDVSFYIKRAEQTLDALNNVNVNSMDIRDPELISRKISDSLVELGKAKNYISTINQDDVLINNSATLYDNMSKTLGQLKIQLDDTVARSRDVPQITVRPPTPISDVAEKLSPQAKRVAESIRTMTTSDPRLGGGLDESEDIDEIDNEFSDEY